MKGKFIVFEGIDGSGKSTQIKLLRDELIKRGYKVFYTFEPTKKEGIGITLRKCLVNEIQAGERTIAALFLADRIEHVFQKGGLKEKKEEGFIVLCDRYYFSSFAYNCQSKYMDWVMDIHSVCRDSMRPDLNVFLDCSPEKSLERIMARGEQKQIYENVETLKQVRERYLIAFDKLQNEERVAVIPANDAPEAIFERVLAVVMELLEE